MGRVHMVMQLDGTATAIKRRDKSKRIKCTDCGESVKLRKEVVWQDGKPYHLLCAGFVHAPKVAPCLTCFVVAPCLCVGV